MHKESRKDTNKSGEESAEQSGDESGEDSGEEDDLDNEALLIQKNLIELESGERGHSVDLQEYSYTRLPCAAHKVRLDSL